MRQHLKQIPLNLKILIQQASLTLLLKKKDFKHTGPDGITWKILEVRKTETATIILLESVTPAFSVFNILYTIESRIKKGEYKDLPEQLQLAERDAYTFEHLSEEAIEVFYPEAHEMKKNDIKQYLPVEKQQPSLKSEL